MYASLNDVSGCYFFHVSNYFLQRKYTVSVVQKTNSVCVLFLNLIIYLKFVRRICLLFLNEFFSRSLFVRRRMQFNVQWMRMKLIHMIKLLISLTLEIFGHCSVHSFSFMWFVWAFWVRIHSPCIKFKCTIEKLRPMRRGTKN